MAKKKTKKSGKKSLIALILAIVSLIFIIVGPNTISGIKISITIGIIIAIAAIILGFVGKKESKGKAIAAIVIGFISVVLLGFSMLGIIEIEMLTNCVDNGDGTVTCELLGEEIELEKDNAVLLTEDQYKQE